MSRLSSVWVQDTGPSAVSVSTTPCSAGISPVRKMALLGLHIAVLHVAFSKLTP
jgi:hypothetical protein